MNLEIPQYESSSMALNDSVHGADALSQQNENLNEIQR